METHQGKETVAAAVLGVEERSFEYGGIDQRMRVFRLPDNNPRRAVSPSRRVPLRAEGDDPLHVCVTTEDGHQAWSSPIHSFR